MNESAGDFARRAARDRVTLLWALPALAIPLVAVPALTPHASAPATPADPRPLLHWLLAGFVLLAAGLGILTANRRHGPLESPEGTRRALLYALLYGLVAACFTRVIAPALAGDVRNPWLLALADVVFITLGVFVWVTVVAERRPLAALGFRGAPAGRMLLALLLGVAAATLFAIGPYRELFAKGARLDADLLVFAALHASVGSALPDELLFRGYLMASLDGRVSRGMRILGPALAYTALRALRDLPGLALPPSEWAFYLAGVVFPLGLAWGLMRDLARGSLWPSLVSHVLIEFVTALAGTSPATLRN